MTIQRNIAAKLRFVMTERNQSLEEFSKELGISRSSLQEYLREGANPRIDTVELLANRLGCTPAELISDPSSYALGCTGSMPRVHPMLQPLAEEIYREVLRLSEEIYRKERGDDQKNEAPCP